MYIIAERQPQHTLTAVITAMNNSGNGARPPFVGGRQIPQQNAAGLNLLLGLAGINQQMSGGPNFQRMPLPGPRPRFSGPGFHPNDGPPNFSQSGRDGNRMMGPCPGTINVGRKGPGPVNINMRGSRPMDMPIRGHEPMNNRGPVPPNVAMMRGPKPVNVDMQGSPATSLSNRMMNRLGPEIDLEVTISYFIWKLYFQL